MNVEIFSLCEYASYKDQSLCILHTFENWTIASPRSAFEAVCAIKLRFDYSDGQDHAFVVVLVDPDGRVVCDCPFQVHVEMPDTRSIQHSVVLRINALVSAGHYSVNLRTGDRELTSTPLYVLQK